MAQSTGNARRNKPTKRGKSRRARKIEAKKAPLSASRNALPQRSGDPEETPVPSSKVRKRESAPVLELAASQTPVAATISTLQSDFLARERVFFDRDLGVIDDLEVEAAPVSVEILARRLWFRRLVLRIMLALSAFAVLALTIHFLRQG